MQLHGPGLELLYLPLRARAEALRMMLHFSEIAFTDTVVSLEDWPAIKATMPQGEGAEFPGRPKGNRALPVLKLPNGQMIPDSSSIAEYIATLSPRNLNPTGTTEALELFKMSQSLPLFWPTALLARFPEKVADCIISGDLAALADATFPDATPVLGWLEQQPSWLDCIEMLQTLERRLGANSFFGGSRPHFGDFAVWAQVDSLQLLLGAVKVFAQFGAGFSRWFDAVANLEGIRQYLASRPPPGTTGTGSHGYQLDILLNQRA